MEIDDNDSDDYTYEDAGGWDAVCYNLQKEQDFAKFKQEVLKHLTGMQLGLNNVYVKFEQTIKALKLFKTITPEKMIGMVALLDCADKIEKAQGLAESLSDISDITDQINALKKDIEQRLYKLKL